MSEGMFSDVVVRMSLRVCERCKLDPECQHAHFGLGMCRPVFKGN